MAVNGLADVTAIAPALASGYTVRSDGTATSRGENGDGEPGNGTTIGSGENTALAVATGREKHPAEQHSRDRRSSDGSGRLIR